MNDWSRSVIALGTALAGVVLLTLGLAALLVPQHRSTSVEPRSSGPTERPRAEAPRPVDIPGLGGELTVSGDRGGTFKVSRYAMGTRFGLSGDDGEIYFGTDPFGIEQLNYDGLSFFPDEGQCTLTPPATSEGAVGTGTADLHCEDIADVRGRAVVTISGSIGLPADVLAGMNLPSSGGSVVVGGETWQFEEGTLETWQMPIIAGRTEYAMNLVDADVRGALSFTFDLDLKSLTLANVRVGDESENVPEGACELRSDELGKRDPRTTVLEIWIECAAVTVPGLGEVSISGTVVVDRLEFPA